MSHRDARGRAATPAAGRGAFALDEPIPVAGGQFREVDLALEPVDLVAVILPRTVGKGIHRRAASPRPASRAMAIRGIVLLFPWNPMISARGPETGASLVLRPARAVGSDRSDSASFFASVRARPIGLPPEGGSDRHPSCRELAKKRDLENALALFFLVTEPTPIAGKPSLVHQRRISD